MRALRVDSRAGGRGIGVDEVPAQAPGPGEVAVQVEAAGLNHLDLLISAGRLGVDVSLPHVLGIEGAGLIVDVGPGVPADRVGQRVTVYPYVGCGGCRFCYLGEEQLCAVGQVRCIGMTLPGTMTDVVNVPARNAVELPDALSVRDAAALSMTGMTAYRLVVSRGNVRPGETVLVRAVGSGVGSVALQLAKLAGATVIGTAGSSQKLDEAAKLGMDEGIDHSQGSIAPRIKELTGGKGVDVVLDYVGSATWDDNVRALGRWGRLLICGAHTGTKVGLDIWHLFAKEHQLIGSYGGTRQDLKAALESAAREDIVPVVDRVVRLEDAGEALAAMEARAHFGKLVLTLEDGHG